MRAVHELENRVTGKVRHMLTMQDVSNWQGNKVPSLVEKNEILAVKATEGNFFTDPEFGNNWKFAEDNEKGRVAYHFLHCSIPGMQQAQFFLDFIDKFGLENGDMLACDHETTDGQDKEVCNQVAKEFCDFLESQTKGNPWLYTNLFMAQSGNCDLLGNRPLWIADPSSPPGRPRVPHPWTEWTAHQYGVIRGVDADVVNADNIDQLAKYGVLLGNPAPKNIVTVTLTDGKVIKDEEFHEDTTVGSLRGHEILAGDARLEFSK